MTEPIAQDYDPAVPVDTLTEHPDNARRGDVEAIDGSMRQHGFYGAIYAQRGTGRIIAGNHRHRVAVARGVAEVPVIWLDVDDDQARRIMLHDNRTSDLAGYDDDRLAALLADMHSDSELGLVGTGYTVEDLAELTGDDLLEPGPGLDGDPDEVPAEPPVPVTKRGDVWLLGPHRLICGDATDRPTVDSVLGGQRPDIVWTDPPYGIDYVGKTADKLTIENDGAENLEQLLGAAFDVLAAVVRPGCPVYVAAPPGPLSFVFARVLTDRGLFRQRLVWVKDQFVLGHSDYHYQHEDIYLGYTSGPGLGALGRGGDRWYGDNAQTSTLSHPRPRSSTDHPTMKPVSLVAQCLGNSSTAGDVVLDPFGGSGSTLVAAHQLGQAACLVELSPKYCDVICRRYQERSGDIPVLEATGTAHDFTVDTEAG